jgi:hypothetical protein
MLLFKAITITTKETVTGYMFGEDVIRPLGRNVSLKVDPSTIEVASTADKNEDQGLHFIPLDIFEKILCGLEYINEEDEKDEEEVNPSQSNEDLLVHSEE